jgi:nicotinate-nucleotide pyrophosphorylase (carboxylating)
MEEKIRTDILGCIQRALEEDIGAGDATTDAIVPAEAAMNGHILAKQEGIVAGLDVAQTVFRLLDESVDLATHVDEGARVQAGQILASVSGPAQAILKGERVAMNLLGRMSGIATLTRRFVEAVAGTGAIILDTRKTAPGLRALDKLAVRRGGGENHRMGLYDMILIKDNHIDLAGSLEEAVRLAQAANTELEIEVEARTIEDVRQAVELGVKRIMLDNMEVDQMAQAVALVAGRAKLEASGNVRLENVRQIAETGVDYISIGALTHSVQALDVSLDWAAEANQD